MENSRSQQFLKREMPPHTVVPTKFLFFFQQYECSFCSTKDWESMKQKKKTV